MNRRLLTACAATALVVVPSASAAVQVKLSATTHTPKVGQAWRWTLTVTNGSGAPVAAKARFQLVAFGAVVGCWKGGRMQQCSGANAGDLVSFVGRKVGTIRWTAESRGVRLTFRAVVTSAGRTTKVGYQVTVA